MKGYYRFISRAGEFRIIQLANQNWIAWFDEETLGGQFRRPQYVLPDLCGGHTDWPA